MKAPLATAKQRRNAIIFILLYINTVQYMYIAKAACSLLSSVAAAVLSIWDFRSVSAATRFFSPSKRRFGVI